MADADKKMKAAFDKYDKDGNGYVTAAEVKAVIEDMLPGIDANVLEKIAKSYMKDDKNKDSKIDFEEFKAGVTSFGLF